jgi:hypothetical protein
VYPFESILSYNPARGPQFFQAVIANRAAIQCVLMCNSMFRSLSGEHIAKPSEFLARQVSKVCALVNKDLDRLTPRETLKITLECIATLAWVAVGLVPL